MTSPAPVTHADGRIDYAKTLDHRTKMMILFGVLLGLFLSALDQTIVGTAMPKIISQLHGLDLYTWVTTAYLLANTALVPIYGKLSDLYGRKPILMFGIFVFLLGSALCGMAGEPFLGNLFGGGMMQLVVFRALQGAGGAALGAVAFAIIADLFEPADRPRYQGLFGAVFGLSSVIGPLAGGWLTDHVSWRWVFYVNLPLGVVALLFLWFKMPRLASGVKAQVDWLGAAFILGFAVPLLLALTFGADAAYGWTHPTVLALFAGSFLSLLAFLLVERRHPSPIIPLSLFKNPTFTWGSLARFMFGAAFLGAILFLSLYLVQVQGVSATKAGTATIPLTFGLIVGAVTSGQIASRMGKYKPLMLVGLSLMMLGFFWLSTLTADTSYGSVVTRMVLLGLGMGPAMPLYTTALQLAVKPQEIGVATSSGQFFQQMGSTIGTAIFGAVLSAGVTQHLGTALADQAKLNAGNSTVAGQLTTIAEKIKSGTGATTSVDRSQTPKTNEQIKAEFQTLKTNVTRAVKTGDAAAIKAIQADTALPAEAKKQLTDIPAGGVGAAIREGTNKTFDTLEAAVKAGNYPQFRAIASNPQLPPALRGGLARIPAQVFAAPAAARAPILAQLEQGRQQGLSAADQQENTVLTQALRGLDDGETVALAAARAQKVAFADTIASIYRYCLVAGLLALLATLMMPNLTLPRRSKGERMAPAHVEI